MYISRPIRFPEDHRDNMPEPPRAGIRSVLVLIVIAMLVVGGTLALSALGVTPACGNEFGTECVLDGD